MTGRRAAHGFTLVEAILVIMLTGIVAAMIGVFIRQPITAYVDQARRAELSDAADLVLRRIARDVQRALPNSVRVDATGRLLEFLPVSDGGRYRAAPDAAGNGDFLDFASSTDNSVSVLPPVSVAAGDQLVVYNLGLPGADAYSGETRRALTSVGNNLTTLTYTVGSAQFPFASPGSRFQIVGKPVTLACVPGAGGSGTLRRYSGYAIQAAQPGNPAAAPLAALGGSNNALLTSLVAGCSFSYASGSGRSGVVIVSLTLSAGGESVTLLHQVLVDNTP